MKQKQPIRRDFRQAVKRERMLVIMGFVIVSTILAGSMIVWNYYNRSITAAYPMTPSAFLAQAKRVNIGDHPDYVMKAVGQFNGQSRESMSVTFALMPDPRLSDKAHKLPTYYIRVDFNEFKRVSRIKKGRM